MVENIKDIVGGANAIPKVTEFLMETVTKLIAVMESTQEMKELMQWQSRKQVVRAGQK